MSLPVRIGYRKSPIHGSSPMRTGVARRPRRRGVVAAECAGSNDHGSPTVTTSVPGRTDQCRAGQRTTTWSNDDPH
jgi:hypothetical protein